jgi:hypothetical protein
MLVYSFIGGKKSFLKLIFRLDEIEIMRNKNLSNRHNVFH